MTSSRLLVAASALGVIVGACSGEDGPVSPGFDGLPGTGGTSATGATTGGVGTGNSGGTTATGGAVSTNSQTGTGGVPSTGGLVGGQSGGAIGTGGASTDGSGQTGTGGASTDGSGQTGTGGASTDGASTGGAASGGSGGTGTIPPMNAPVPSAGCAKATTVTSGTKTITSTGEARSYIIDIPTNYDINKPHRFIYASHWVNGTSEQVENGGYYGLKSLATAANEPAIFVAPQGLNGRWGEKDHALFDDILAFVKENLCIDTTRVFATGFSFGGMITYSLSVNHQKDIRAAVGIAPANYNIYVPTKTNEPIAWMQTTGMDDSTCPWVNGSSATQGAKYIAIEHATNNGCTVPETIPIWQSGNHVCYDFQGCTTGYPTKACTFGGGHVMTDSDSGNTNWIAQESWQFFTQF